MIFKTSARDVWRDSFPIAVPHGYATGLIDYADLPIATVPRKHGWTMVLSVNSDITIVTGDRLFGHSASERELRDLYGKNSEVCKQMSDSFSNRTIYETRKIVKEKSEKYLNGWCMGVKRRIENEG